MPARHCSSALLRSQLLPFLFVVAGLAVPLAPVAAQTPAQSDSAAKAAASARELPLIPTRTLSFTTSEGTWISLDVAPDGGTLVFELLGD